MSWKKMMLAGDANAGPALQQCMAQKMQTMKFPSFQNPRMGATFSFYVGN